jgi:hypothetical protein
VSIVPRSRGSLMPHSRPARPPFSMRHAFALAFELAVRRDPLHSLVIPFALRAPWMVALALMIGGDEAPSSRAVTWQAGLVLIGQSVTWWAVDAMLRIRARSAFNTPRGARLAPVLECYARGMRRLPWLYLTESVRNLALGFAYGFFVIPGVLLSYRLAFSTEAVVLDEHDLIGAFRHSFHLSHGRFERWLEMIATSVALALAVLFATVALYLVFGPTEAWWKWVLAGSLLAAAFWPVIQYAWTFFYLRLIEVESTESGTEVAAPAAAPRVPVVAAVPTAPVAAPEQSAPAEEKLTVS